MKNREDFQERFAKSQLRDAQFHAQWDFDHVWLDLIMAAQKRGEKMVDGRHLTEERTDELYVWALHKLLSEKLGPRFIVEQRIPRWYTLRNPHIKIMWDGYQEPRTRWQRFKSWWVLFRGQRIYGIIC